MGVDIIIIIGSMVTSLKTPKAPHDEKDFAVTGSAFGTLIRL
jgi:hypothetical protein